MRETDLCRHAKSQGQPSSAAEPQTQADPAVKTHSRGRWAVKDHVPHPFVAKLAAEKAGIVASDPEQRQAYENFVYEEALIVTVRFSSLCMAL